MPATEATEQKSDSARAVDEEYKKLEKKFLVDRRRVVLADYDQATEGGFGIVRQATLHQSPYLPAWLALRRYGPPQLVAVKQIKISTVSNLPRVKRAFTREMLVWSGLEAHPGIAKFLGFYADLKRSEAWFLSPWEPNGNVSEFLKAHKLEVPEKLSLVYDTIDALAFLHQLDPPVCHGDIKSPNVLVTAEYKARLCDFGLARLHEDSGFGRLETSSGAKGSIRWCSPELIDGAARTPNSDVYAWAWLVWEIMTGSLPYEGTSAEYAIIRKIFESPGPEVDGESRLSDCLQIWDLMIRCWTVEPGERPTARICKTTVTYLPRCTPTPANASHHIRPAELLENLGDLEIWKGNLGKSSAHLDGALLLYQEEGDSRGIANVLRKQAVAAYRDFDYGKARDKAIAALKLFRNLNDDLGIADASLWLGRALTMQGKLSESLPVLEESLEIYRSHENDNGTTHCLERIGEIQRAKSQTEEALLTLDEAAAVARRSGDRMGMARALRTLARVHFYRSDFVNAASACSKALEIAWSIGWELGLTSSLRIMRDIKVRSGDYYETEEVIRGSITIARQRNLRRVLKLSLEMLANHFRKQSKYNEAIAPLEELTTLLQGRLLQKQSEEAASIPVELKSGHDRITSSHIQKEHLKVADHLIYKGDILAKLERYDEAALHFEAAIAKYRGNGKSWGNGWEQLCAIPKTVMKWERR